MSLRQESSCLTTGAKWNLRNIQVKQRREKGEARERIQVFSDEATMTLDLIQKIGKLCKKN